MRDSVKHLPIRWNGWSGNHGDVVIPLTPLPYRLSREGHLPAGGTWNRTDSGIRWEVRINTKADLPPGLDDTGSHIGRSVIDKLLGVLNTEGHALTDTLTDFHHHLRRGINSKNSLGNLDKAVNISIPPVNETIPDTRETIPEADTVVMANGLHVALFAASSITNTRGTSVADP